MIILLPLSLSLSPPPSLSAAVVSSVLLGLLPWEIRIAFHGESQLRQSQATQLRYMLGVLVFP